VPCNNVPKLKIGERREGHKGDKDAFGPCYARTRSATVNGLTLV